MPSSINNTINNNKPSQYTLRSNYVNNFIGRIPPALARWGTVVIAFILMTLIVVAFTVPYPHLVQSEAQVQTPHSAIVFLPKSHSDQVVVGDSLRLQVSLLGQEVRYVYAFVDSVSKLPCDSHPNNSICFVSCNANSLPSQANVSALLLVRKRSFASFFFHQ